MNLDALIGRSLRQSNLRYLDFAESPGGVRLPVPDPDARYLLYLHVPYCTVLCPFCSFHRVKFQHDNAKSYFARLREEIRLVTASGYRFDELYVGGGTPTIMPEELIRTIEEVREQHSIAGISVETNPNSLDRDGLHRLRVAGVNRLSVGVQSFDNELLAEMQRLPTYGTGEEIRERLKQMQGVFDTLNVDMIFNFPHQTETTLRQDLQVLTDELAVDQVSYYPLMTAGDTAARMRRTMGQVDETRERDFYRIIAGHMLGAGYERSSAWCFSRNVGMFDEYIAERDDYVGLGSGAFSYLQGSLYVSAFSIGDYESLVDAGRTGTIRRRSLTAREQMRYHLLVKLFSGSLPLAAAEERFTARFQRSLWPELAALKAMGSIRQRGDELVLTESGQYLWVVLMREFLTAVNSLRNAMRGGQALTDLPARYSRSVTDTSHGDS